jgi:ribose-phosphate pyrophosphokinase
MNETQNSDLRVIGMRGCDEMVDQVDYYLKEWHETEETFLAQADLPRFGSGEAKAHIIQSMRGQDVYIISDCFNYGVKYKMYGMEVPMSPDDHFQDLKRVIGAIGGKARRITVIMPMLYEGRQHKRTARESLDCAIALQELVRMGVTNIITFDAHDSRVQNAIPLAGFDNVRCTYQMIKAICKNVPDIQLDREHVAVVSPDEGGMSRCMYYSSVLGLDLGMFYKRRNYSVVVDGTNPIEAHEYLGRDLHGKDAIIVDDMISSGGSIIEVASQLKERGAARIFVFSTFGLFCNGLEMFDEEYKKGTFDKIFTTNLIYRSDELKKREWYAEVNMCKYIAYIIDTLNKNHSISELLNPVSRIKNYLEKRNSAKAEEAAKNN